LGLTRQRRDLRNHPLLVCRGEGSGRVGGAAGLHKVVQKRVNGKERRLSNLQEKATRKGETAAVPALPSKKEGRRGSPTKGTVQKGKKRGLSGDGSVKKSRGETEVKGDSALWREYGSVSVSNSKTPTKTWK